MCNVVNFWIGESSWKIKNWDRFCKTLYVVGYSLWNGNHVRLSWLQCANWSRLNSSSNNLVNYSWFIWLKLDKSILISINRETPLRVVSLAISEDIIPILWTISARININSQSRCLIHIIIQINYLINSWTRWKSKDLTASCLNLKVKTIFKRSYGLTCHIG